jgi:hypothetical protein
MPHTCRPSGECDRKLDAALAALQESSRLLVESIFSGPNDQVEERFVSFRAAKLTLFEALAFYKARLADSA